MMKVNFLFSSSMIVGQLLFSFETYGEDLGIVIDNSPIPFIQDGVGLELEGYRLFSDVFSEKGISTKGEIGVPIEAIFNAANKVTEVNEAMDYLGIRDINSFKGNYDNIKLLEKAIKIGKNNISKNDKSFPENTIYSYIVDSDSLYVSTHKLPMSGDVLLDFVASDAMDFKNFGHKEIKGKKEAVVWMKSGFTQKINYIYANMSIINKLDGREISKEYESMLAKYKQNELFENGLKKSYGKVSFGKILSFTSKEKNLKIPRSLEEKYNIYFIEFPITYRDIERESTKEIGFNVYFSSDVWVLDLFPLRFGREVEKSEFQKTPELGVGYGSAHVNLGEFYGQTVTYKYLVPTVVAYGLREDSCSWALRDEAISSGSHIFVALLAVPKNKNEINLRLSAYLKKKNASMWEEKYSTASSSIQKYNLKF